MVPKCWVWIIQNDALSTNRKAVPIGKHNVILEVRSKPLILTSYRENLWHLL